MRRPMTLLPLVAGLTLAGVSAAAEPTGFAIVTP